MKEKGQLADIWTLIELREVGMTLCNNFLRTADGPIKPANWAIIIDVFLCD